MNDEAWVECSSSADPKGWRELNGMRPVFLFGSVAVVSGCMMESYQARAHDPVQLATSYEARTLGATGIALPLFSQNQRPIVEAKARRAEAEANVQVYGDAMIFYAGAGISALALLLLRRRRAGVDGGKH